MCARDCVAQHALDEAIQGTHALGVKQVHFTSIDEVYAFVMGFVNVEKGQATEFKLDRMRWMAERLDNPHLGRVTVHVAGSKGKGSVATLIARAIQASGTRTGLYTSPHILSWKERMTEAGDEIPDEIILSAAEEVFALTAGKRPDDFPGSELPTYFELTTLIAFCAFRRADFRAQVIEVGLGGRLDSTNIVASDVAAITPIELEHTQFLGSTIPLIAGEKAGIIKPRVPVCALQPKIEALEVIQARATALHAPLYVVGKDVSLRDILVNLEGTAVTLQATNLSSRGDSAALQRLFGGTTLKVSTDLVGSVYAGNMALATLALAQVPLNIRAEHILRGFRSTRIPARFEIIARSPLLVLDGAHTPESIRGVLTTFLELAPGPRHLLFACAHDKRHEEMARLLAPHFEEITVTRPGSFKQSDPIAVFQSFSTLKAECALVENTKMAIERAARIAREERASLLVTGSFYLCAEFKKWKSGSE